LNWSFIIIGVAVIVIGTLALLLVSRQWGKSVSDKARAQARAKKAAEHVKIASSSNIDDPVSRL